MAKCDSTFRPHEHWTQRKWSKLGHQNPIVATGLFTLKAASNAPGNKRQNVTWLHFSRRTLHPVWFCLSANLFFQLIPCNCPLVTPVILDSVGECSCWPSVNALFCNFSCVLSGEVFFFWGGVGVFFELCPDTHWLTSGLGGAVVNYTYTQGRPCEQTLIHTAVSAESN